MIKKFQSTDCCLLAATPTFLVVLKEIKVVWAAAIQISEKKT